MPLGRVVRLATDPELSGITGRYFESDKMVEPAPPARDEALAKRLWVESERLTGLAPGDARAPRPRPAASTAQPELRRRPKPAPPARPDPPWTTGKSCVRTRPSR